MRRPWPLLQPLGEELRQSSSVRGLVPQQLTEVVDGLARLRYDDPKLLDALEIVIDRTLEQREALHEAQACTILEALGSLNYQGRSGALTMKLLERLSAAQQSLLPHSAVALLHGLALLHVEPPPPLAIADIMKSMAGSGLAMDAGEVGTMLWSLVELACADTAMEAARSLPADIIESVHTSDLHTLTLCLWSLLTLRCYDHRLTKAVLQALGTMAAGVTQPAHLCRLAECMLMLQLEAPQELGLSLPQLLMQKAQYAWQQVQAARLLPGRLLPFADDHRLPCPLCHRFNRSCRASARRSLCWRSVRMVPTP